ncbi:MAG: hypothetical protein HGB12_01340, partial [Bacteroidetes bacterium]|nr:hypothetical protein [Bacteroidota bacterium]
EAFAKAYLHWGTQCANHINGDYAVVIIDRKKNEVYLFRDHIGTRPLVYWFHENRLIFASHEFGLVKSGLVSASLCEEKFINHLFRFKGNYTQTVFQNILKVIPGYFISFSPKRKKSTKYWKPEKIRQYKNLSFDDAVARLRQLLVSATLNRMEQDKTGVHVSGGIDSGGVASIIVDHTEDKAQLYGYSWTPDEFEGEYEGADEKEFIDAFSEEKGIPVNYLKLKENEAVIDALIPEFETQHIEHPTMKMAENDGVKTLFSGWGGDEFVSLSTRGTFNHLFFSFKWFTLGRFIIKSGIKSGIKRMWREVFPLLIPFGLVHTYKTQYTDWSKLRLLEPFFVLKHWKQIFFHSRKNFYGYGNRTRFALNLLHNYHIPERMDSWAIHAERYGFEYKYPLLDKDLLEFWFSIPIKYTYQDFNSRLLYREAMKGILTEKIRTRRDKGEGLRIAYSRQNRNNGEEYIKQLLKTIPEKSHLSFFRPEVLQKVIDKNSGKQKIKEIFKENQPLIYLRYVELVKKYL